MPKKYFDIDGSEISEKKALRRRQEYRDSHGFCELHKNVFKISWDVHAVAPNRGSLHHIKKKSQGRLEHADNYIALCNFHHLCCEGEHSRAYRALCESIKKGDH